MADLSSIGFEPIKNSEPESKRDLSSIGFEPSEIQTREISNIPKESIKPVETKPTDVGDMATAFLKGAGRGVGDTALELENLVGNVLSKLPGASYLGKIIEDKTKGHFEPSQIELENPVSSSLGAGIGYTGGMIAGPAGAVRAIGSIPKIASAARTVGPIISGAVREGATGAIQGAAMQPDERGLGASIGAGVGGLLGGVGGYLGSKAQQFAGEIQPVFEKAKYLNLDPYSPEGLAAARAEMSTRGLGQIRENIKDKTVLEAQKRIEDIKPDSANIPDKSPNQILVDKQNQNFSVVKQTKDEAYAPLTESTGTIGTQDIVDLSNSLLKSTKNKYLPEEEIAKPLLSGNATFEQLQTYRQELDTGIRAAKAAQVPPKEMKKLFEIRKEVSTSMADNAESQGLGDQFAKAEEIYKNQYLPFRTFSKSGKLQTPEESDQAWQKINSIMAQNNPDPKKLRDLVSTLGDEGKDLVGWATLQNAMQSAKIGEEISLTKFNNAVNKYRISGLDDIISKPAYKEAIKGINRVVGYGKDLLNAKTNRIYLPILSPVVEHLIQTSTGIKLLIGLGSQSKQSKFYRDAIQSLFTGITNISGQKVMQPK